MESTVGELQEELDRVRQQLAAAGDLDDIDQQIHEKQQELSRLHSLDAACLEQIEQYREEEVQHAKRAEMHQQTIRDQMKLVAKKHEEEMNAMQQAINETNAKCEVVRAQIKLQKKLEATKEDSVSRENEQLNRIDVMTDENHRLQRRIDEMDRENQAFSAQIREVEGELECLKERWEYSSAESVQCREAIDTLQKEVAELRTAIEAVTTTPLDVGSRGNSLFAEVHDHKHKLQASLSRLRNHYLAIQGEHEDLVSEVRKVEAENRFMAARWEAAVEHEQHQADEADNWCKEKIVKLSERIKEQRTVFHNAFMFVTKNVAESQVQYYDNLFNSKEERIVQALDTLLLTALERIDKVRLLNAARHDLSAMKARKRQLESQLQSLETDRDLLYVEKKIDTQCKCKPKQPEVLEMKFSNFARANQPNATATPSFKLLNLANLSLSNAKKEDKAANLKSSNDMKKVSSLESKKRPY